MSDKRAAIKRASIRTELMNAYKAYRGREPASMDRLLECVRKFAYMKLYHLEHDFKGFGSAETADDWAQDVAIKVLHDLDKKVFETPADFYSWVHKIAFNKSTDAFNSLKEKKATEVPLFIKSEEGGDENGDTYEEENPLIHHQNGHDTYVHVEIPASVQGVDLTICYLLLQGVDVEKNGVYVRKSRTYAEVGNVLGITEDAVKKRLSRLKRRLKAEGEQKKHGLTNAMAAD